MAQNVCSISLETVHFPAYPYQQEGDDGERVLCSARFHIDALCSYIADKIIREDGDLNCPMCRRPINGIRLDLRQVVHQGEEPTVIPIVNDVEVRSLAKRISECFRENNLVDGHPRVQQLTMDEIRQIQYELNHPPGLRDELPDETYLFTAKSIAILAGGVFVIYVLVKHFDPPENLPKPSIDYRGTLVDLRNLELS